MLGRTRHGDGEAVRLRGVEPGNSGAVRTLLTPFDRVVPIACPVSFKKVRPRRWLHALRRAALETHPFGALRHADESRIRLLPYQLEPALAILRRGATRVLIADDVGLGKTIQAGLILRELAARDDALRAIVVMPAALRDQWRDELRDRFALASHVADAVWLACMSRELPADVNPWSLPGIYIASYDFVKRPEVLRPLEDVTWDLTVFDEAHAAAPGTDRRAAADALASRARRVVLLTATPHGGDEAQFEALCRLGRLDQPGPLLTFQRSRMDAGTAVPRRTVLMTVRPSPAERRVHRLLERYSSRIQRESASADPRALLAAIVLRKRALSSAASLQASAARRQELLAGSEPVRARQLALPLGDEDPVPDDIADDTLAAPGLTDGAREQRMLSAIVRAGREAAARETKTAFLTRLLRRVREPALVFTEYRDTLARLAAALENKGFRPRMLHGGMTPDERTDAQRAFNADGGVLLATDAASEGLNLHHRCRLVVHYELPWTPLRLLQRTGRVDRIGQARRVHEILLVAGDTAERLVLAPLARRIASACRTTAGSSRLFESLTESRVAAAVLSGRELAAPEGERSPAIADGAHAELHTDAEGELQRLRDRRAWRAQSVRDFNERPSAARLPMTALERTAAVDPHTRLVLVYTVRLRDADGQVVHAELVPVALSDGHDEVAAVTHLQHGLARRLGEIAGAHQSVAAALEQRERAIAAAIPGAARQVVQAGLFDRRAIRTADARRHAAGVLLAEADDRRDALHASRQLTASFDVRAKLVVGRAPHP